MTPQCLDNSSGTTTAKTVLHMVKDLCNIPSVENPIIASGTSKPSGDFSSCQCACVPERPCLANNALHSRSRYIQGTSTRCHGAQLASCRPNFGAMRMAESRAYSKHISFAFLGGSLDRRARREVFALSGVMRSGSLFTVHSLLSTKAKFCRATPLLIMRV